MAVNGYGKRKGTTNPVSPSSHMTPASPTNHKHRLLFMGLKRLKAPRSLGIIAKEIRSGKSSIINVVLYKLPPTETIWDLPGQIDFLETSFDTDSIYGAAGAMVWVLDAQDDYIESINRLTETILQLQQTYPEIKYSVFIHKTDSLSSDFQEDTVNDIIQRIMDDLNDAGLENPPVSFYATSVYDHSIYEALSKVLQILNPQLATFESMLNTISASCKLQKIYLFDINSKLYVASDTLPMDMAGYALCSDFIDTIVDLSGIYSWDREGRRELENGSTEQDEQDEQDDKIGDEEGFESFISGVRGTTCLYLKLVHRYLALIGFSREPRFSEEKPLVDFNVQIFQDALSQVLALT